MNLLITIENLSKTYIQDSKEIIALKNINLNIEKGEIFGIIGLSGAGKSTLIRCINRLEEPDSGKIIIDNVNITNLDKNELREERKGIGMIFQSFNLLSSKNVYDNIAFPLRLEKMNKKDIDKRTKELVKYVELEDKINSYPAQLSGGQKQRVAVGRALANNPKVLLSDEGTSALDPITTKSILALLKKIRDEFNVTIIMITHQMEVVKDICDRVAIIENGKIIESNTVEKLFRHPKTKISRSFINSLNINTDESVPLPKIDHGKLIRLSFSKKNARKPVVSDMIKKFNISVNILSGNIYDLNKTSVGYLIVQVDGENEEIEKSLSWLNNQGINFEVI